VAVAKSKVALGDEVGVRVLVTAGSDDLTGVGLDHGLVSSSDAVEVSRTPSGLTGFDLAAGSSKSFAFTVKGAKPGTASLTASASGSSTSGPVIGSGDAMLEVIGARPTAIQMACDYAPSKFIGFGRITTQSCFVTVRDLGPAPFETPVGKVDFKSIDRTTIGVITPNPCALSASVSNGVSECEVSLDPGSNTKAGETLGVDASFVPSTDKFKSSGTEFKALYTPMLDPTNKADAAELEAHLIALYASEGAAGASLGALAYKAPITAPVAGPLAATFGLLASTTALISVPYHYMQTPKEPPDPAYTSVFRPRIPRSPVLTVKPKALMVALTALNTTSLAIDGWAGADWNALNRSVIAQEHSNRSAFVTQMLAASKDEAELATLVSKLPSELQTVKRLSPAQVASLSVDATPAQLAALKRSIAKPTAAQKRLATSVGLDPSLITSLIAARSSDLTAAVVDGNVFAKLKTLAATEASGADFLKKVSAVHAAMAALYK
jgi:hypothetical protein